MIIVRLLSRVGTPDSRPVARCRGRPPRLLPKDYATTTARV